MAVSPMLGAEGAVRVTLLSDGAPVGDAVRLHGVEVRRGVGLIPAASLIVDDGEMPTGDWPVADAATFKPGAAITIRAGYGDDDAVIFTGIVVRLGVRIGRDNFSRLQVHCQDTAVKMTVGRNNATWSDTTDGDVIGRLIAAHGLAADVAATSITYGELVQYYCSDWDYVMARAEANGLQVVVTDGTVAVAAAATSDPALTVAWGVDLLDFSADLDAREQFTTVTGVAWDPKAQATASGTAAVATVGDAGNIPAATLAAAVGPDATTLLSATRLAPAALDAWARAQQVRAALSRLQGRMRFQGSAAARVGGMITVAGVGERFSGDVFVGGVAHDIADGEWTTEVEFGLANDRFTERPDVVAPTAAGWVPGAAGLQVGIVVKVADDPQGEQRVQVRLPVLGTANAPIWARLMQPYASKGFGAFFLPEVGDEVVIGYFNDDPANPTILGSLYSSNRTPPYPPAPANDTKAIVTRSTARIEINDADIVITVATPAKNQIVISDKEKTITLSDETGNTIVTGPSGIALRSPKDITLNATGAISLDAVQGVTVTAGQNVAIAGLNIVADAKVAFTGKGAATAELSAGGEVTVHGALVMIN